MTPLCIHSQRPWRKGWQFVCCTGEPDEARMCAKTSRELDVRREIAQVPVVPGRLDAVERRRASRSAPYQPMPKPSPFVVSAPSVEWRLWSISECCGL